jgi:hypothetical protein
MVEQILIYDVATDCGLYLIQSLTRPCYYSHRFDDSLYWIGIGTFLSASVRAYDFLEGSDGILDVLDTAKTDPFPRESSGLRWSKV